jgi:hypothetical protein
VYELVCIKRAKYKVIKLSCNWNAQSRIVTETSSKTEHIGSDSIVHDDVVVPCFKSLLWMFN